MAHPWAKKCVNLQPKYHPQRHGLLAQHSRKRSPFREKHAHPSRKVPPTDARPDSQQSRRIPMFHLKTCSLFTSFTKGGKLGQTSTNFQVKRGKSARNIGIDTSSSTQHRFRPGIPPSMSCKLVSAVTLFAGSRVIETVRNTTRPGASSNIADCLSTTGTTARPASSPSGSTGTERNS